MKDIPIVSKHVMRRRRFQQGSLQKRKSGGCWSWIAFWWEAGRRRSRILGQCANMSRPQARAEMAKTLQPVNARAGEPIPRSWTVGDWIRDTFLPFIRRKWKLSTASTSGDRIKQHLIRDLDKTQLQSVTRELLQQYLEKKAASGFSFSLVDHLRWDLRAIFRLAVQDGYLASNPAELLFTPVKVNKPSRKVLSGEQVQTILDALELREKLIVQLALFSGMRPGEILALQWKHVGEDHVHVVQRLYRGKLDRPKTQRSKRKVAMSLTTSQLMKRWQEKRADLATPDAWVFPSAKTKTAMRRDNVWRWAISPRLQPLKLEWATFQVMRRTHASLSRQAGIDPKLVADQLGHGLGVNLDVYTVAALDKRRQAVEVLEASLTQPGAETASQEACH
jgi:integrase